MVVSDGDGTHGPKGPESLGEPFLPNLTWSLAIGKVAGGHPVVVTAGLSWE